MNKNLFGRQLRAIREKRGISQEELANVLGISDRTVYQIETGRRLTTISNLVKICEFFNISPEFLLLTEINRELENVNSDYQELYTLMLELKKGEIYQTKDFIELLIKNRERYNQ